MSYLDLGRFVNPKAEKVKNLNRQKVEPWVKGSVQPGGQAFIGFMR